MDVRLNRRDLLRTGGLVALAASLPAVVPGVARAQEPASAPVFLGTAPDAGDERIRAKYGDRISTLFPHQGMVYYGYGNYSTNSGSQSGLGTNVSCYNPQTAAFEVQLQAYNTEEINVFRQFSDGSLNAPAIDWFNSQASFASNRSGSWAAMGKVGAVHVYDVAEGLNGEVFVCGSGSGARVWRSPDGGATWEVVFTEPVDEGNTDGFERNYWMARVGNRIYWKADPGTYFAVRPPMRYFDLLTRELGTVDDDVIDTGWVASPMSRDGRLIPGYRITLGDRIHEANAVVSNGRKAYFHSYGRVWSFDGQRTVVIAESNVWGLSRDEHGQVYYSTGESGVYRVNADDSVTLVDPTPVGRYFAILDGKVYFTQGDGTELWVKDLDTTITPEPEPEPGDDDPRDDEPGKDKGKKDKDKKGKKDKDKKGNKDKPGKGKVKGPDHPSNQPGKGKGRGNGKDGSSAVI